MDDAIGGDTLDTLQKSQLKQSELKVKLNDMLDTDADSAPRPSRTT